MRIFYGFAHLPHFEHPSATVGSYDGVHGGHMTLINSVVESAKAQHGESIVLTFDPHPRVTLGCAEGLQLLTSTEEKALLLEQAGIDNLIVIPFDHAFSLLTPYEFAHDYLIGRVGVETLVVGYNHHFGHDKEGNFDYLDRLHDQFNFHVLRVAEYDSESEKVSSTVIRRLVERGEMAHAARMMPHPYLLIGEVVDNSIYIAEPLKLLPPAGIYNVIINGASDQLTITADGSLRTNATLSAGKVIITFKS
ncbi:MAG: FAD synthetase [Alistipes sp.]